MRRRGRVLSRRTKLRMVGGFVLVPPAIALFTFGGFLLLLSQSVAAIRRGSGSRRCRRQCGIAVGILALLLIIAGATLMNLAAATLGRGRDLYDIDATGVRMLIGLVCGTAGAVLFWLVAVRGTELDEHDSPNDAHAGNRYASLRAR